MASQATYAYLLTSRRFDHRSLLPICVIMFGALKFVSKQFRNLATCIKLAFTFGLTKHRVSSQPAEKEKNKCSPPAQEDSFLYPLVSRLPWLVSPYFSRCSCAPPQ